MKNIVVAATILLTLLGNVGTASAKSHTPREWYPGYNGSYSHFEGAKLFFAVREWASGGTG